jgi:MoaA/NifB/PqqE/SkfB family radical SAM enzyme
MDQRRWNNITRARLSYERGDTVTSDYPIEAFFEIAARCNLHCQMCAINYDSRYAPRSGRPPFFEPNLFERLRPIFPSLHRAYLFGLGEPTLNKHLVEYIGELSSLGVEVWFNTNATLIDEEKAEAIARAGAQRITVSIDGATAETYETIRRGAKFDSVTRGIRALIDAGRRYGRPQVNLSFVARSSNVGEIPALVDFCAEVGATGVHVEPLFQQPTSGDLMDHYSRENLGVRDANEVAEIFADAHERAARQGVALATRFTGQREKFDYVEHAKSIRAEWACSEPWSSIWVTSAGEVRTCCINDYTFGNLFEQTFEEIWNGAPYRAFRAAHVAREIAEGCGNCVRNGRVRQSPFFRTIQRVTYTPLFKELPPASAGDPITIENPAGGATTSDPLVVNGSLSASLDRVDVELMIDETPIANFGDRGEFDGDAFTLRAPIGYVTEGAHVVWARLRGDARGYGHREVFLWRPNA